MDDNESAPLPSTPLAFELPQPPETWEDLHERRVKMSQIFDAGATCSLVPHDLSAAQVEFVVARFRDPAAADWRPQIYDTLPLASVCILKVLLRENSYTACPALAPTWHDEPVNLFFSNAPASYAHSGPSSPLPLRPW